LALAAGGGETERVMSEQQSEDKRPMTYYDVLDLDRDATPEEIKEAYYKLAREHHPDVASDDPDVARRFALISESYRTLSDSQRRHQYDRTLPQKSYPLRHPTPQKIWREATDVVLIRSDRFGPLNQAMQAAVPIVVDEDVLVITMPGSERHLAGHMETASNRNSLRNALELVAGQRLDFRIIDGSTAEEWYALKQAESRTKQAAARPRGEAAGAEAQAIPGRPGEGPWDALVQRVHREYQRLPRRQYPQSKARYLREALGWIIRLDEELRYDSEEDAHERAVARAIERVAAVLDLPPVFVALEFDRMKRGGEV
jgi:curved DNA-binding protein CbpA